MQNVRRDAPDCWGEGVGKKFGKSDNVVYIVWYDMCNFEKDEDAEERKKKSLKMKMNLKKKGI